MRKFLLCAAALLAVAVCSAQPRSAYKVGGIAHIKSDRTYIGAAKDPFYVSVERVVFADNTEGYILELDYEKSVNVIFPKGVKLSVANDKGVRDSFSQYFTDSDKKQFRSVDGKSNFYYNVAKYLITPEQMKRICAGVKSMEVAYGWNPDEFYSYTFKGDEFASAVSAKVNVINSAKVPAEEIGSNIAQYSNNRNTLTVITKTMGADGNRFSAKAMLVYFYYKETNIQEYEMHLYLTDELTATLGEKIVFGLEDGSSIVLEQQREGPGLLVLYPTEHDLSRMSFVGVNSISFMSTDGPVSAEFQSGVLTKAVGTLYNSLKTLTIK